MEPALTINELRARIYQTLGPLIAPQCCVLDIPTHLNSGDHFIWAGERQFLSDIGREPVYTAALKFTDRRNIPAGTQILFQGGGNFGDIYRSHQAHRMQSIRTFRNHPILVLPQTVWFHERENLRQCAEAISGHPDITVCARDRRSFGILQEHFPRIRSLLVPDMVFCMRLPERDSTPRPTRGILYLVRDDGEDGNAAMRAMIPQHADRLDWPALRRILAPYRYAFSLAANRLLWPVSRALNITMGLQNDAGGPFQYHRTDDHVRESVALFGSYELVITERLHGHLLACLMGIPSILLDNSYGKCKAFHETWLKDIPGSYFADSPEKFEHVLKILGI